MKLLEAICSPSIFNFLLIPYLLIYTSFIYAIYTMSIKSVCSKEKKGRASSERIWVLIMSKEIRFLPYSLSRHGCKVTL